MLRRDEPCPNRPRAQPMKLLLHAQVSPDKNPNGSLFDFDAAAQLGSGCMRLHSFDAALNRCLHHFTSLWLLRRVFLRKREREA
jgi:hypothetical protein